MYCYYLTNGIFKVIEFDRKIKLLVITLSNSKQLGTYTRHSRSRETMRT